MVQPRGLEAPARAAPRGLLTQQEASGEGALGWALPGTKSSPNQPEPPSVSGLRAVLLPHVPLPAPAAGGMLSRQSTPPKSQARREPRGNADGSVTGGFYRCARLRSIPLPSKQLLGSDPVHQVRREPSEPAGSLLGDTNVFQHAGSYLIGAFPGGRGVRASARALSAGLCRGMMLLPSSAVNS